MPPVNAEDATHDAVGYGDRVLAVGTVGTDHPPPTDRVVDVVDVHLRMPQLVDAQHYGRAVGHRRHQYPRGLLRQQCHHATSSTRCGATVAAASATSQSTKSLLHSAHGDRCVRISRIASAASYPSSIKISAVTRPDRLRPAWQRISTRSPARHRCHAQTAARSKRSRSTPLTSPSPKPYRSSSTSHETGCAHA